MKVTGFKKTISLILCLMLIASSFAFCVSAELDGNSGKWIAGWGTSAVDYYISLEDYVDDLRVNGTIYGGTTMRTELEITASGDKLRIRFSNRYGTTPVNITRAMVAKTGSSSGTITGKSVRLTFDGRKNGAMQPGETIWSDEIDFEVKAGDKISVSTYYGLITYYKTAGLFGGTTYISTGVASQCDNKRLVNKTNVNIANALYTYKVIPFLTNIDVHSKSDDAFSIAFIGDSTLVNNTTKFINKRLIDAGYDNIGVIDEGIMGNRLLHNGTSLLGTLYGDNFLSRLDRDALNLTGVDVVFVKIGANDILHPSSKTMNAPYSSVEDITNGFKEVINRVKDAGKKIYFMEITPWKGYTREVLNSADVKWTSSLQKMTDEVNSWIRNESVANGADGFFSAPSLGDVLDPTKLCTQFTIDGAHLTDYGSMVLADSIDLQTALGLEKNIRSISEILQIDPFEMSPEKVAKKNTLQTVANFVRQLVSNLRLQFENIRDFTANLFGKRYQRAMSL